MNESVLLREQRSKRAACTVVWRSALNLHLLGKRRKVW
jgi:hypothetical protein